MFTGLVQTTGVLGERAARGPGFRAVVSAVLPPLELGESIAVNGVCLTVTEITTNGFACDISAETVERTTLGRLPLGATLNLERALRAGDALGGHFVAGHVDGLARVERIESFGEARRVTIRPPAELAPFFAPKGSVTLDGVSLTINESQGTSFAIMLIPHTLERTSLKHLVSGTELNLEVDLLARYVLFALESGARSREPVVEQALAQSGWLP